MITSLDSLYVGAQQTRTLAVAAAHDAPVLLAVEAARKAGLAKAVLVGDEAQLSQLAEQYAIPLSECAQGLCQWPSPLPMQTAWWKKADLRYPPRSDQRTARSASISALFQNAANEKAQRVRRLAPDHDPCSIWPYTRRSCFL